MGKAMENYKVSENHIDARGTFTPAEREAVAGVFDAIREKVLDFFRENAELAEPLPARVKHSLLVACSALGIMLSPEVAHGQSTGQEGNSLLQKLPEVEVSKEVGMGSQAWVGNVDPGKIELGTKIDFDNIVFVREPRTDQGGLEPTQIVPKHRSVSGAEFDTASTVVEKGPLALKALGELHKDEYGWAWFFGNEADVKLPRNTTAYMNVGKYTVFSPSDFGHKKDEAPKFRLKAGLEVALNEHFQKILPGAAVYVEYGVHGGDEAGAIVGIKMQLGGKGKTGE